MNTTKTSIADIRRTIRAATWLRNDLGGHTREEFLRRNVEAELNAKIDQLSALFILPRFTQDRAARDEEIALCARVIHRWKALNNNEHCMSLFDRQGNFSHAPTYSKAEYTETEVQAIGEEWVRKGGTHYVLHFKTGK